MGPCSQHPWQPLNLVSILSSACSVICCCSVFNTSGESEETQPVPWQTIIIFLSWFPTCSCLFNLLLLVSPLPEYLCNSIRSHFSISSLADYHGRSQSTRTDACNGFQAELQISGGLPL